MWGDANSCAGNICSAAELPDKALMKSGHADHKRVLPRCPSQHCCIYDDSDDSKHEPTSNRKQNKDQEQSQAYSEMTTAFTVLQACGEEPAVVQAAYEQLLGRPGGDPSKPDVRAPVLRIRILKSLHAVLLARHAEMLKQRHRCQYQSYRQIERTEVGASEYC